MASDPLLRPAGRLAAVPVDALSGCSELLGAPRRTPWWGGKDHGPTVRGVSPGPCRPNGQARIGFSSTSLGEAPQWLTSSCDPSGRWCQPVRQGQPSGLRSVVLPDGDNPTDPRRPGRVPHRTMLEAEPYKEKVNGRRAKAGMANVDGACRSGHRWRGHDYCCLPLIASSYGTLPNSLLGAAPGTSLAGRTLDSTADRTRGQVVVRPHLGTPRCGDRPRPRFRVSATSTWYRVSMA